MSSIGTATLDELEHNYFNAAGGDDYVDHAIALELIKRCKELHGQIEAMTATCLEHQTVIRLQSTEIKHLHTMLEANLKEK